MQPRIWVKLGDQLTKVLYEAPRHASDKDQVRQARPRWYFSEVGHRTIFIRIKMAYMAFGSNILIRKSNGGGGTSSLGTRDHAAARGAL
jgi:hypothetical protein